MAYKPTPHAVFVTNDKQKQSLLNFILDTKFVNLYFDCTQSYHHLNESMDYFNRLLTPYMQSETNKVDASSFNEIKSDANLLCDTSAHNESACVVVVKPNQSLNVVFRLLRAIANINPTKLSPYDPNFIRVSKLEMV